MDKPRFYQMGKCPKCKRRFRLTLEADKECLCKRCFWAEIEASVNYPTPEGEGLLDRSSRERWAG